jgi:toxin ParE1/3/4
MGTKAEVILSEALSMSPAERARIAHCLISSLDQPAEKNVDEEWLELAEKRLSELESGRVKPVTWEALKQKIRG